MIAGLEFGNAWMLGWLAAAALPWLVNLWAKNRYDETPWAAIALLREALQRESQRIRRQNWLLLATRTAVVALAALAVTRPAWRGADAGPLARSAVHSVVVVDCSLSMAVWTATDGGDGSNRDALVETPCGRSETGGRCVGCCEALGVGVISRCRACPWPRTAPPPRRP